MKTPYAAPAVIPVKGTVLHKRPHHDEAVARTIFVDYGEPRFPGAAKSYVRFAESNVVGTDQSYDADGLVPIGCGYGRFDEHRNSDEDRMPGECAATLVAKYLGIEQDPALQRLLAETYECDAKACCTTTQLAELMKMGYRCLAADSAKVLQWAMTGIRALIKQEKYHFGPVDGEKTLLQIWEDIIKAEEASTPAGDVEASQPNAKVHGYIVGKLKASMANKGRFVTELASVVEALYRFPYAEQVVIDWVEFALMGMREDQIQFVAEVERLKSLKPVTIYALLGRQEHPIDLLVCPDSCFYTQKAARNLGARIVLARTTAGNFQIHTDRKLQNGGFNLANVIRMIRWLELPADKKKGADWQSLGRAGIHPDVPAIAYAKSAEAIYNGTLTHDAPASELSTQAIVEAIRYGCSWEAVKIWCNARGIRINPERSQPNKKPSVTHDYRDAADTAGPGSFALGQATQGLDKVQTV